MFLASNYTFEAFFWIILIAIVLVTLTIFFATPKPVSKKPQDWNVSHLKGTIGGVNSAKPTGIQKEIQDTSSENIEKETAPEIIVIKKPINYRKIAFAIFGVVLIIGSVSLLQSTFNLFNEQEECELIPYGKCSGVDLNGQNLSGLNLTGIDLSYADLTGLHNLRWADLTGAIVTDADFTSTTWYQTIWTDGVVYYENQA